MTRRRIDESNLPTFDVIGKSTAASIKDLNNALNKMSEETGKLGENVKKGVEKALRGHAAAERQRASVGTISQAQYEHQFKPTAMAVGLHKVGDIGDKNRSIITKEIASDYQRYKAVGATRNLQSFILETENKEARQRAMMGLSTGERMMTAGKLRYQRTREAGEVRAASAHSFFGSMAGGFQEHIGSRLQAVRAGAGQALGAATKPVFAAGGVALGVLLKISAGVLAIVAGIAVLAVAAAEIKRFFANAMGIKTKGQAFEDRARAKFGLAARYGDIGKKELEKPTDRQIKDMLVSSHGPMSSAQEAELVGDYYVDVLRQRSGQRKDYTAPEVRGTSTLGMRPRTIAREQEVMNLRGEINQRQQELAPGVYEKFDTWLSKLGTEIKTSVKEGLSEATVKAIVEQAADQAYSPEHK